MRKKKIAKNGFIEKINNGINNVIDGDTKTKIIATIIVVIVTLGACLLMKVNM